MTREHLEQQYLVVDRMTFTPRYTYTRNEVIQDGETIFVDDYTITATAQEVYQEYLSQKNAVAPPTEIDLLKEQVINLQAYEVEKVEKKYQEVTNV